MNKQIEVLVEKYTCLLLFFLNYDDYNHEICCYRKEKKKLFHYFRCN